MGALSHYSIVPPSVLVVILFVELLRPSLCQVGFRTLPLTASSNNRSTKLGLFSKWSQNAPSNPGANSPSLEMELAAILRDIAYGVSTDSTTTTSSTTEAPTTTRYFRDPLNSARIPPPSSIPVSNPREENVWGNHSPNQDGAKPVQHQYIESPTLDPPDDYVMIPDDSESRVTKVDVGVNEVPWPTSIGVMWEVHVYTTAGLFSLLVLLSLYCLTRIYLSSQLIPRGYYITIHLLVFLAAFFRCVYFFHDPYAAAKRLPDGLSNLLFNTGTPCITTALAVLILALLRAARLIILPMNLQSPVVVGVISGALLACSIIIDIFGGVLKERDITPGLKGIAQAITAGWGAALCIGYIILFIRIERSAKQQQNEIVRVAFSRVHVEGSSLPRRFPKSSLKFGARFTLVACIAGILLAALQVYGLINSDIVIELPPLQPWVWFVYQSSCRFLEIAMWTSICVASALPANLSKCERRKTEVDERKSMRLFLCKSCSSCSNLSSCCIYNKSSTDDMYSTICQTNHVARNFGIHNTEKLVPQDTIATTGHPSKHISTTLLPPQTRKSVIKPSTHSKGPDGQMLWNNCTSATLSHSSSRPSSLVLTEGGLIQFRTHDPRSETVRIVNYPVKEFDPKVEFHETQKKMLENSAEDNYINSGALTPEEKRILEKSFYSSKSPHRKINEGNESYRDITQQNASCNKENRRGKPTLRSPKHDISSFHNKGSSRHDFDVHFYEDGENRFYQSPSLDSSIDSGGHIYASVQHSIDQGHRQHQFKHREHDGDFPQGKILNNSGFVYQPAAHHQSRRSSSNQSQLDVIVTDYLTDVSQEHTESPSEHPRTLFVGSPDYFPQRSGTFYSAQNERSPIHAYHCYLPEYPFEKHFDHSETSKSPSHYKAVRTGYEEENCHNYNESDDVNDEGCTFSHPQKTMFSNGRGSLNFENVSYTPLPGEDDQRQDHDQSRLCSHRPIPNCHSPLPSDGHSQRFESHSSPSANRRATSTSSSRVRLEEEENTKAPFQKSLKDIETSRPRLCKESGVGAVNPQIDFSVARGNKFLEEGMPWTDLRTSQKVLSESLSQEPSMVRSNAEIHSSCRESNSDASSTEKSMESRWPLKYKDETGV